MANIEHLFKADPQLQQDFVHFEQKIKQLAQIMQLDLMRYEIDHLALRANTFNKAEQWRIALEKCGEILSHNNINGRPIFLFKLSQPVLFLDQKVCIIELPYPKDKVYPYESWEHIEVVMPFLNKESSDEWQKRLLSQFKWNKDLALKVKINEPKADGEVLPNPSIAVSLCDEQQNYCKIKVHPYNISQVIEVY